MHDVDRRLKFYSLALVLPDDRPYLVQTMRFDLMTRDVVMSRQNAVQRTQNAGHV